MLKVIAAAPAVTQESLLIGMTSFPLNKTKSGCTFSLFSGIHGEPGIKRAKVGKTRHCLFYLSVL